MKYNKLFNISFIDVSLSDPIKELKKGSFMVVPSGPGLATIDKDFKYWDAIKNSDFALPDSGFMIILYRLFFLKKMNKCSGARFIINFLKEKSLRKEKNIFLIDPNEIESIKNRKYLNHQKIKLTQEYQYIAPFYDKEDIKDNKLISILENLEIKPKFILINLGGGVQERLGYHLKKHLTFKVGIICTGAAIAFLTGSQAKIPKFIDKFYLGWLFRIIQHPRSFLIRYLKAFRLIYVFIKFRLGKIKNE